MRAIQTLWTAGQSLHDTSFGWCHPRYHLMAWALSCLELERHNKKVVLCADSAAARVLGDRLRLPYTDIEVRYDDVPVSPCHWAFAKVLTYSVQEEPFLHVDGDVFLPSGLAGKVLDAAVVAQNKERGTAYYRAMVDNVVGRYGLKLPGYLREAVGRQSVASFNSGVFGGSDIGFIREYCDEVFRLFALNGMFRRNAERVNGFNVQFEQMLLAAFAECSGKMVTTVLDGICRDNGYGCSFFRMSGMTGPVGKERRWLLMALLLDTGLLFLAFEY